MHKATISLCQIFFNIKAKNFSWIIVFACINRYGTCNLLLITGFCLYSLMLKFPNICSGILPNNNFVILKISLRCFRFHIQLIIKSFIYFQISLVFIDICFILAFGYYLRSIFNVNFDYIKWISIQEHGDWWWHGVVTWLCCWLAFMEEIADFDVIGSFTIPVTTQYVKSIFHCAATWCYLNFVILKDSEDPVWSM